MVSSSLDILKEVEGKVERPLYYHDVNIPKGINKVTCKLMKIEGVLMLERSLSVHITEQALYILEKVLYALETRSTILMSKSDLEAMTKLVSTVYGLEDLDRVIVHVRGHLVLSSEEIKEWSNSIRDILNKGTELKDMSKNHLKATFDDGLNDFRVIVPVDFLEKEEVGVGDIVTITLEENRFTVYEGYLVACTHMDTLMGYKEIKKEG